MKKSITTKKRGLMTSLLSLAAMANVSAFSNSGSLGWVPVANAKVGRAKPEKKKKRKQQKASRIKNRR